jgi:hypothetical protein
VTRKNFGYLQTMKLATASRSSPKPNWQIPVVACCIPPTTTCGFPRGHTTRVQGNESGNRDTPPKRNGPKFRDLYSGGPKNNERLKFTTARCPSSTISPGLYRANVPFGNPASVAEPKFVCEGVVREFNIGGSRVISCPISTASSRRSQQSLLFRTRPENETSQPFRQFRTE